MSDPCIMSDVAYQATTMELILSENGEIKYAAQKQQALRGLCKPGLPHCMHAARDPLVLTECLFEPQLGEMPRKQWLVQQSQRAGATSHVHHSMHNGSNDVRRLLNLSVLQDVHRAVQQ